ncbi:MAG: DUF1553 domain-containing protein [Pirellulales bacterium]|nr:DUF1553 domain-containing protein [Pirellulales bacterium]
MPAIRDRTWPQNPIDAFVLAALEDEGLRPAPPADPSVLLRRVTMDLIGLPPRADEADAYSRDGSEDAYRDVVVRLLGSPHYGERWGRHWLDVARYADSAGYEFDNHREIWRYRDWVINSLNADMPYDQFLVEQFAGDLLPNATQNQRIATGFSCNALKQYGDVHETTTDRVNAFGAAVLGLTLGCASCHDHKFDPISQQEYYQLYAFFNDAEDAVLDLSPPEITAARDALQRQIDMLKKELFIYQNGPDPDPLAWAAQLTGSELRATPSEVRQSIIRSSADRTPEQVELIRQHHRNLLGRFQRRLEDRIAAWGGRLTEDERRLLGPEAAAYFDRPLSERSTGRPPGLMAKFWEQDAGRRKRQEVIDSLEKVIPDTQTTLVLQARSDHPQTFVFIRGNHLNLGREVQPATPAALPPLQPEGARATRLDLARWAASPENPLTARVIVNRIWQAYFGLGIVETSEDFGTQAPKPRQAALLDWLAAELIDGGWRLKHLHQLIVSSATYRQSSHQRPDLQEADPQNRLLARQSRLRFEAEIIRDAALAVSGLLNDEIGGPSVFPYQPEGVMAGRADGAPWKMSEGSLRFRRGMYTHFWRLTPHPYLTLFDAPDAAEACTRRSRSNTPVQALTLLNDPSFKEAAAALARRVVAESSCATDQERLAWAFKECLGRSPAAEELAALDRVLRRQRASFEPDPARARQITDSPEGAPAPEVVTLAAWTSVSRALLNLDEFITRE